MKEELEKLRVQKDQAYSERNKVVAALARTIRNLGLDVYVAKHIEEDWEDDWRNILVIELPTGQITWHFHDSELDLLKTFKVREGYIYDGHTTEEKYQRLLNYTLWL
jgi:hypothetical protein